ncbi:pyridoxamine 5'-phosphate oxidase family protein [Halosimplex amylolyticum]|uniref:pyridoxamine 5'-phosphate oxidase family protein n=1 Tax=Halosimplex amylolyticum TaxID=3396616 RepID=UPI003F57D6A0
MPAEYQDLFEKRSFAFVPTLLPDGSPHVAPRWVDSDGEHVLVNPIKNDRKDENVRNGPRVTLAIATWRPRIGISRFVARSSNAVKTGPATTWIRWPNGRPQGRDFPFSNTCWSPFRPVRSVPVLRK